MTDRGASNRDAAYLASQMVTNARVLSMQSRMVRARERLHGILIEVTEEAGAAERPRAPDEVPIPPLDRTVSVPRVSRAPEAFLHPTTYLFLAKKTAGS